MILFKNSEHSNTPTSHNHIKNLSLHTLNVSEYGKPDSISNHPFKTVAHIFYPRGICHNHSTMTFKILAVDDITKTALLYIFQFYRYLHTIDNMKSIVSF